MNLKSILIITCIFLTTPILLAEELVMVQTVSSDQTSFAIRKGAEEDIRIGMQALFSTKNATVKAQVIKTTRHYSLWQLKEKAGKFPFKKNSFVTYNKDLDTIWYAVPTVKTKYNLKSWRPNTYWTLRTGHSYTLSESVTDTSAKDKPVRSNFQVELMWHKQVRKQRIDWGWGVRYDSETAQTSSPVIVTLPTSRILLNTQFTFHFPRDNKTKNNFFGAVAIALGQSTTKVDTETSSGYALVFPQVTFGFIKQIGKRRAVLIEASAEVINTQEKFEDGTLQTSNMLNAKIALGLKF